MRNKALQEIQRTSGYFARRINVPYYQAAVLYSLPYAQEQKAKIEAPKASDDSSSKGLLSRLEKYHYGKRQ